MTLFSNQNINIQKTFFNRFECNTAVLKKWNVAVFPNQSDIIACNLQGVGLLWTSISKFMSWIFLYAVFLYHNCSHFEVCFFKLYITTHIYIYLASWNCSASIEFFVNLLLRPFGFFHKLHMCCTIVSPFCFQVNNVLYPQI